MSLATGVLMAGVGSAGLLVPLVTRVVDTIGWQMAMMILGLVVILVVSPLSFIIRSHPENRAYSPAPEPVLEEQKFQVQHNENEVGIKQALKNRVFWHIAIAYTFHFLVGLAVVTNIMPYLSTIGITRNTASFLVSALAIGDIIGRLLFGWAGQRLDRRYTAASGTALVTLSLLLFTCVMPVAGWVILPAVIIVGAGFGGTVTVHSVLLRDYFGTGKLGSIIGFSVGITRIGVMIGPPLASWIFERFNSYDIAWLVLAGMAFIGVISLLTSPPVHISKQKALIQT
jgi:sugar phosphate permease